MKMKRIIQIVVVLFLSLIALNARAEEAEDDGRIIRLGVGSSVLANCGRVDFGGRVNLHVRAERFAPFELEMGYTIARGGLDFMLLVDVIRSRFYINWHLDVGVYFPLGTRPFNNLELERNFDLVFGTGIDVEIPQMPNFVVYLSAHFYLPDPGAISHAARSNGMEAAGQIVDNFGVEALEDLDGFIENEYTRVIDAFDGTSESIISDAFRSVVISVGMKYYF